MRPGRLEDRGEGQSVVPRDFERDVTRGGAARAGGQAPRRRLRTSRDGGCPDPNRSETSAPTPARGDARTHLSARKFVATERDILACLPRACGDQACSTPGPRTRVTRATRAPQTPRARPGGSLSADSSKKRVARNSRPRRNRHRLQLDGCVCGTDAPWLPSFPFPKHILSRSLAQPRSPTRTRSTEQTPRRGTPNRTPRE